MRDDARTLADEITRLYADKVSRLQKLLLSESDKHHYEKIGNLDRLRELVRDDDRAIEEINLIDYDIARAEASLSGLVGIKPGSLYTVLADGVPEAAALIAARKLAGEALELLCRERAELTRKLEAGAERLKKDMSELTSISRLKERDDDE